ncbi:MAG: hypothetical protein ACYTBJ_06505 [Planctomycetota bacterium]|jgi:hypothetical protein
MTKKGERFYRIFKSELSKRFQLVNEDGTPLGLSREKQDNDGLSKELSEEEMEAMGITEEEVEEEKLASEIGGFLDGIVEKLESEEEGDGGDK